MISTNHELFSADPPVSFLKNKGQILLGPVPEEELVLFGNLCSALNRCGNSLARSTRAVHRIGGNSTQIRVGTQIERAESRTSPTRIVPTAPIRVGHCWCSSPWPCLPALTTSPPFSDTPSSSPRPNALGLAFRARKAPLSAKSPATPPCATCSSESIPTNWPTASIVGFRPTSAPFPAPWPWTANGFAIAP